MSHYLKLALVFSLLAPLRAQQGPSELLQKIRAKVMDTIGRLPRFMCTQTLERTRNEPLAGFKAPNCATLERMRSDGALVLHPAVSDRLRFDVGVTGNREIYSWAGENRFDDRSLLDLASGTISTGSFAAFLRIVFETDTARAILRPADEFNPNMPWRAQASVFFLGNQIVDGRTFAKFAFRVPVEESHYVFRNFVKKTVTSAYDVTFLADRETFDLMRMVVTTSEIPEDTGACQASTTLDYKRFHLNDADFLLPISTNLEILNQNGRVNFNRTSYSGCHEFLGESTLKFESPADASSPMNGEPSIGELRAGHRFTVALAHDLDLSKAAAGDAVDFKLAGTVGELSAGATVRARIVQLERDYLGDLWRVQIKLENVNAGGTSVPIHAVPADVSKLTPEQERLFRSRGIQLGTLKTLQNRSAALIESRNATKNYILKAGARTQWVTTAPEHN